ncbi:hypothetical protein [Microvirga sp. GCM10011540]|uniref:hypothetical protein n=1 Tax=Microvirga sp. GCM10011540 TaxID=3317338 RepID=UPI00366C3A2E
MPGKKKEIDRAEDKDGLGNVSLSSSRRAAGGKAGRAKGGRSSDSIPAPAIKVEDEQMPKS